MEWVLVVILGIQTVVVFASKGHDMLRKENARMRVFDDMNGEFVKNIVSVFGQEAARYVQIHGGNVFFRNRYLGPFLTRFHLDSEKGMIFYNYKKGMRYAYFRKMRDGTFAPYIDLILDENGKDVTR